MMLAGHHRTMASLIMNNIKAPEPRDEHSDDAHIKEERAPNSWNGISVEDARDQVLGGGLAAKQAGKKGFWGTRSGKHG